MCVCGMGGWGGGGGGARLLNKVARCSLAAVPHPALHPADPSSHCTPAVPWPTCLPLPWMAARCTAEASVVHSRQTGPEERSCSRGLGSQTEHDETEGQGGMTRQAGERPRRASEVATAPNSSSSLPTNPTHQQPLSLPAGRRSGCA